MNRKNLKTNLKKIIWLFTLLLLFVGNVSNTTISVKAETTVYVTKTGSKYHTGKCGNGTYYPATLSQAIARGLTSCSKCFGSSIIIYDEGDSGNSDYNPLPPENFEQIEIEVEPIKINKTSMLLVQGQTSKLEITNATEEVVWKSSKESVVSVSSDGKITAKKKGNAEITATVGEQTKSCKVTVEEPKLKKKSLTMDIGDKYKLSLAGCKHSVKWSSGNSAIAIVRSGKITAKKPGKTTIVAKVHNQKYKCTINVNKPKVKKISLKQKKIQMGYNKYAQININVSPKNALKYHKVSVKSSNRKIVKASVSYDKKSIKLETGEKTGTAKITVSIGEKTAVCEVNVIPSVISEISLNKTELRLNPDGESEICLTVNPTEALNYYDVEWISSNPSVVTVEKQIGYKRYADVIAVGEGEATVTVKIGEATASCRVVVSKPRIVGLELNKTELHLNPDGESEICLTVNPTEALNYYDVEWISSNPSVVTVEKQIGYKRYADVIAVGEGEATVTVKIGEATATCRVVVKK